MKKLEEKNRNLIENLQDARISSITVDPVGTFKPLQTGYYSQGSFAAIAVGMLVAGFGLGIFIYGTFVKNENHSLNLTTKMSRFHPKLLRTEHVREKGAKQAI